MRGRLSPDPRRLGRTRRSCGRLCRSSVRSSPPAHAELLWKTYGVAFEVRFLETSRGARIAFSVEGTGPPLVVLPPWTSHLAGEMALSGHRPSTTC